MPRAQDLTRIVEARDLMMRLLAAASYDAQPADGSGAKASGTSESGIDIRQSRVAADMRRDAEVHKNVEIIAARLADAVDLERRDQLSDGAVKRLSELSCEAGTAHGLEALLETRRCIERLLLEEADVILLKQVTAAEYAQEEATLITWRELYGPELPDVLNVSVGDPPDHIVERTRLRLQRLVAARFEEYRTLRARRRMRGRYLLLLTGVVSLTGLLFAAAVTLWVAWRTVVLALAGGAVGASLSGWLRFRDDVSLGSQMRGFMPVYLAQAVVGAVFGLVVVLVVEAGWLNWSFTDVGLGAIAVAAGFSEPFAVGVVARTTAGPTAATQ